MRKVLTNFCEVIWLSFANFENSFFVFLCLIKLGAETFRSTQNLIKKLTVGERY